MSPSRTSKSYDEIIDFIVAGHPPQDVIEFRPSAAVHAKVAELIQFSKDATISVEQQSELDDFFELDHLMILAKARARQLMHRAG